jgi:hypothetical protein
LGFGRAVQPIRRRVRAGIRVGAGRARPPLLLLVAIGGLGGIVVVAASWLLAPLIRSSYYCRRRLANPE